MSVQTDQANFALLYLDDLAVAEFETRGQVEIAKADCIAMARPFISLRWGERGGRKVWMPKETHYLSNL